MRMHRRARAYEEQKQVQLHSNPAAAVYMIEARHGLALFGTHYAVHSHCVHSEEPCAVSILGLLDMAGLRPLLRNTVQHYDNWCYGASQTI